VDTQALIKVLAKLKDVAGFQLKLINYSLPLDNQYQMILHGALMLDLDQDQLLLPLEEIAMFPPQRNLTAESLAPPKKTARQVAAAGIQQVIHLVLLTLLGVTTRKVLTLALHQHGMLKIQDSQMISSL
jgi:hypothetical protein